MRFLADENFNNQILEHDYFLLSHDVNTMQGYFYDRVKAGLAVPGLFLVHGTKSVGDVIDTLELIIAASETEEWKGKITFLPF